ncbi:MAG: outer membrane protein assembly factor BamA [Gammaproteobacteria bacterium]|nr:outer membrane protein assembly factor BamA [Gammaproteobacteria bacterium]NNF50695.1 outer membrane protein assembly factor BamA [Woeseiaceae bacterium]MBT8093957.1 outer membrane protein assembly factor BamA [Gammaproteobacteria bacterium]MBT8106577.1 outer membrane protein assembly factor BamA [Gammaproteobacteria bacterium]NNK26592.1 outer membrane protein assembly factor BamA [Woeseiaceae bacterium]
MRQTVFALLLMAPLTSMAAGEFVVRDMRVEGLQRISEGTVFNYLPINVGDTVDNIRIGEAIRTLYGQNLFNDIEMRRDGDTLVVAVRERPSIESFTIEGNKDIKTEDLMDSLRSVGLARGRTFDRSVLDNVEMFLRDQYYDRGKYGVAIESDIQDRPNNTVRVKIDVKEGDRAKIRQVNIIGDDSFDEDEIRADFELDTANWLSWIRQDDRYAKEALEGDLETLRSFYMDRGYADFEVESTQVAISPNKKDIFLTINIDEGEVYTISEVKLVGEMAIDEALLRRLVLAQPGSIFNQYLLTQSADAMSFRLGAEGYANAEIEPVPELDHENKEAAITFYINPQNRVYVRNINFRGVDQVDDEVLRREMRQFEGSFLSNLLVDRSKIRLQRLPYVENVQVENSPVPGSPDLVDVNFDIEYRMPGQFSGGVGYSESQKVMLNGSVVHTNFLGSGNRVAIDLNSGRYQKLYSISHTDPYRTMDGVRRTVGINYRDITQFTSAASDFSTTSAGATIDYGYPISEYQTLSFGATFQHSELLSSANSTQQSQDWVANNGNPFIENIGSGLVFTGTEFDTVELIAGWTYDSRNRALFANRGTRQQFFLSMAVPGSDVEFYQARYSFTKYFPLWSNKWTLRLNTELGIGEAMGDTTALPPYKQFYGGGPQSVRGFKESYLGPRDSFGRPYGGNVLVASQVELILPLPEKFASQARASLFYDIGNVFNTGEVSFTDKLGAPIEYKPDFDDLRASVGVGVQWLAPLGLFRFSYAYPLNPYSGNDRYFGDELERFQFSIGQAF